MRLPFVGLFVALALSARADAPRRGAAKNKAKAVIELADVTVRFDRKPIARLHRNGSSEMLPTGPDGKLATGPKLHRDGTIDLTKAGYKARIEEDGDVVVISPPSAAQPDIVFGHLQGDRFEMTTGVSLHLDGSKIITVYKDDPTALGVVDPPKRARAALLLLIAHSIEYDLASR